MTAAKGNTDNSAAKGIHGVFLEIFGKGILLTGPAGCGKSRCALELLERGHRLIADDGPLFCRQGEQVIGSCPAPFQSLIEIRGLGLMDVQQHYGPSATMQQKTLELIIHFSDKLDPNLRPLRPAFKPYLILGIAIPSLSIALAFKNNMTMLVESAVRLAFAPPSTHIEKVAYILEAL